MSQRSHSPIVAVILSLIPGLGHAYVQRPRRGLFIALPWLALIAAAFLAVVLDRHDLEFAVAGSSAFLTVITAVIIVLLLYHLAVIVDAFMLAGGTLRSVTRLSGRARLAGPAMIAVLLVTTFFYGVAASDTYAGSQALSNIFGEAPVFISDNGTPPPDYSQPPDDEAFDTLPPDLMDTPAPSAAESPSGSAAPSASATPGSSASPSSSSTPGSSPTPMPTPTPKAKPPVVYSLGNLPNFTGSAKDWAVDGQLNVLLIGIDAGPGGSRYYGLRPDSMILLQVDIATGRAAMYGIPRNLINVPLPPESAKHYACHCFGPGPGQTATDFLIDYLWNEAANVHPAWYAQYGTGSGSTAKFLRGLGALEGAVSEIANLQVDGAVVINLPGFVQLIDALAPNGLHIDVQYEVKQDSRFGYEKPDGSGDLYHIDIKAGPQVMNGTVALEFARLRHVIGHDSDYYRMRRQQQVQRAVRAQVDPCSLLPQVQPILNALGRSVWTNLPESDAPTIAGLAAKVGTSNTADFSFDPATTGASYDVLDQTSLNKIHSIVAHGLDGLPAGTGGGGGLSC